MSNNIRLAANKIEEVADRLAKRNDPRSAELHRYAQFLGQMGQGGGQDGAQGQTFDPSQETAQMNSGGGNPMIESFVRKNNTQIDSRVQHVLTVTITAPPELSESKMMNYILGISELGAEPSNFSWARKEQKQNQMG